LLTAVYAAIPTQTTPMRCAAGNTRNTPNCRVRGLSVSRVVMMRAKTCPSCKTKFEPARPLQVACGWQCAIQHTANLKAKRERKETRERKVKARTRREWVPFAQSAFNKFIRLRDADKPCISCGRVKVEMTTGGAWDCGHYLTVGSHPELRFDENNAAKQCKSCNAGAGKYAKKNHTVSQSYRVNLIERIGLEAVEALEGPHPAKHYTVDDLKAIKADYTRKAKELA